MAVLSNDKNVFGNIVPSVYINKITIDNGGGVPNPQLMDRIVAHTDNKATTGVVGSDFNEKYYEQSNYATTKSDKSLKMSVEYCIKDGIDGSIGDLLASWSTSGDLQNYTNVYFLLVDDPLAAKLLSVGGNISNKYNPSYIEKSLYYAISPLIKQGILSENDKQKLISMGVSEQSFELGTGAVLSGAGTTPAQIRSKLYDFVQKSIVVDNLTSLKNIVQESALSAEIQIDDKGKKVKNYKFTKNYEYKTNEPENLTIIAACSLNLESMEETFGLDLSFLKIQGKIVGKRAVQNIFSNGKIASTNFLYCLKSNSEVWNGQVYRLGSKYYTTPNSATGQELERKAVTNNKIQDFRISERVARLRFDLSFLQNGVFSMAEAHKITRDKTDVHKSPPYFTKNYLSRDFEGNARFMFGLDYYSLVRDLTLFAERFLPIQPDNPFALLGHRQAAQILSMTIKRKRVDVVPRSNRLGTYNAKEIPFRTGFMDEPHIRAEEIVTRVVAGSESVASSGGTIFNSNPTSNVNSLKEVDFAALDLNALSAGMLGFRYFTADDFQIKDFTDGQYQYGIEMEILDRSSGYIINDVLNLIEAYKQLSIYYTEASTPKIYYNTRTGMFKKTLAEKYANKEFKPWSFAINRLINVLYKYKQDEEVFDSEQFKQQLELTCHPNTGTPRGLETLLDLVLNASSKLSEMVGSSLNPSSISKIGAGSDNVAVSADNIFSSSPDKRIIKIEHWVDDSFNSDIPKRFGYDFLNPLGKSKAPSGRGLKTVSGAGFNIRLQKEMKKYFKVENPSDFTMRETDGGMVFTPNDTIYESLFSYLSPSVVNLGVSSAGNPKDVTGKNPPSYSLLEDSTPFMGSSLAGDISKQAFYDRKGYSYIASKIMNYNTNAVLPPRDTTVTQANNTLLSQANDKIKYNCQQILASRNCVAVMSDVMLTTNQPDDFAGLFMSDFLGEEIDITDPLENNVIKLEEVKDDVLNISYKGGAEVSAFLSFIYGYSNGCGGLTTLKKPADLNNKKEIPFDINFFSPENSGAATIQGAKNIIGKIRAIMLQQGNVNALMLDGEAPTKLQNQLKALPNQIKALMLQDNNNARVRSQWNKATGNPSKDPYYKACFAFNYRNLKRVEYLAGYEYGKAPKSASGKIDELGNSVTVPAQPGERPMIGSPVWKTLSAEAYTSAIGKKLFCRLKTYSKPEFGIVPLECLEMPVFDEFFMLEPSSYDGGFIQSPPAPTPPPASQEEDAGYAESYTNSFPPMNEPTEEEKVQIDTGGLFTGGSGMDPGNPLNSQQAGFIPGFVGGAAGGVDVGTGGGDYGTQGTPFNTAVGQQGAGNFGTIGGSGTGEPGVQGGPLGGGSDPWNENVNLNDI